MAAIPIGGSLWLDSTGRTVETSVIGKEEVISVSHDGDWTRRYRLELAPPEGSLFKRYVTASAERYDAIRRGDTVRVRTLDCCPMFARMADRTTFAWVREVAHDLTFNLRWPLWLLVGFACMIAAFKLGRPAVLATGVFWFLAAFTIPRNDRPPPKPPGGGREAKARVTAVELIDEVFRGRRSGGWDLPQPYVVVGLTFVPAGRRDSVVAVDAVDSGSVAGLAWGATLPVRYDPAFPRAARLVAGRRTHPERNRSLYWSMIAGIPAGVTALALVALRRKKKPRAPAVPV
jgi:hypothetical protein